jgi:hypothetical protein
MRSLEKESASITMVGSFNPSIFQPRWLGSRGLMRPEDADSATIGIIQAQVADFQTEWFRIQVLQNRFLLQSLDATHYGPLRDLAAGMFVLLSHTPVSRIAMSRWFHYKMESAEEWHEYGHKLAPKELWFPLIEAPGLRSMVMQGRRKGVSDGDLFVKAEPSSLIQPGLFVEVTEDFVKSTDTEAKDAQWIPDRLEKNWDDVMKYAEDVAHDLMEALRRK